MDSSSSPPVLYLGDDDDDNNNNGNEQNHYFETNMSLSQASSSSTDMNLPRKKRKLSNANVRVNTSIVNWSKRQRNDHYQQRLSQNSINSDVDSELILLDPNEYVIEKPDSHSYRSFDWTIQSEPTLTPTKLTSNPIPKVPRVSMTTPSNVVKRPIEKSNAISVTNSNDKFIQQQRKSVTMPSSPLVPLPLPLPKSTSTFARPNNVQRGRPVKNSRVLNTQPTSPPSPIRSQPEQPIFAPKQQTSRPLPPLLPTTTASASSINNASLEVRRQLLNGTGIFSAFHDSRYYRCNICKFKSVTSSTLLQHLFTHMFFCDHCSFYTYSYFNLSQHMFEKHHINLIEEIHEPLNPKSFDLLYVTRCSDGTFALCMDSSLSTTNKISTNDQQFIISSATPTDQHQNKLPKKKILQKNQLSREEDNDIVLITDKRETNHRRSLVQSKRKEKHNQTYVIMKHRRCYSMKKPSYSHSLTLEYNICREHTIRYMSHTQEIEKRRNFLNKFHNTRLIDEAANCLKTIVNNIVNAEENSNQSSLVQPLPNGILNLILSTNNLNTLTSLLKLNNKYDQYIEQNQLSEDEYSLRQSREHIFILSSPETNHTEQSIISALHSSMTNGDSIFTQTKVEKLSTNYDNTHRYLKGDSNLQSQPTTSNSKVQKKVSATEPSSTSKPVPFRPIISKPSRSSVDRNNNPFVPSKSKAIPSIIILD